MAVAPIRNFSPYPPILFKVQKTRSFPGYVQTVVSFTDTLRGEKI